MKKYLNNRIIYLKKENARLFSEIMPNNYNKSLIVKVINENEACIRELKQALKFLASDEA